jgi:hypothetical protein
MVILPVSPLLMSYDAAPSVVALSPLLVFDYSQEILPTTANSVVGVVGGAITCTPLPTYTTRGVLLNSLLSYWNSLDACNLFGAKLHTPLDDVQDMRKARVELLQSVHRRKNGWRNEGCDPDNLCSLSDIFAVCGRLMILCLAYQQVILHMNRRTWRDCCSAACSQLNPLGIE